MSNDPDPLEMILEDMAFKGTFSERLVAAMALNSKAKNKLFRDDAFKMRNDAAKIAEDMADSLKEKDANGNMVALANEIANKIRELK